jgi:hypothetical protein
LWYQLLVKGIDMARKNIKMILKPNFLYHDQAAGATWVVVIFFV